MHDMEAAEKITTLNYHETPYQDSSYEVVGEPPGEEVFVPMEIEVIETRDVKVDAMFHDFGGTIGGDSQQPLMHNPVEAQGVGAAGRKDDKDLEAELRIKFEEELSQAKAEAFESGKAAAMQEAQALIDQNNQQVNARVGSIIKDIVTQVNEKVREVEKESIQLVMTLTEKIIPHAVEINPEYILPILQEALGLSETSVIKKVRVSPADLEFIQVVGLHKSIKEFDGSWEFIADDTIRSGCVIETSAGEIVYDLDKAWARIKNNIAKVRV